MFDPELCSRRELRDKKGGGFFDEKRESAALSTVERNEGPALQWRAFRTGRIVPGSKGEKVSDSSLNAASYCKVQVELRFIYLFLPLLILPFLFIWPSYAGGENNNGYCILGSHALCASYFYFVDNLYIGRLFSPLWAEMTAESFYGEAKKEKSFLFRGKTTNRASAIPSPTRSWMPEPPTWPVGCRFPPANGRRSHPPLKRPFPFFKGGWAFI